MDYNLFFQVYLLFIEQNRSTSINCKIKSEKILKFILLFKII